MDTITLSERPLLPAGLWHIDPTRSRVGFAVRKLGYGTMRGSFGVFQGTIDDGTASGTVRVASISTGNEDRDEHLRGLFAADESPEITFHATGFAPAGAREWRIAGDLTIRDRTRPVELLASRSGAGRLQVRGALDRRDYGLTWNRAIEASGVVGTTVRLELDLAVCVTRPAVP